METLNNATVRISLLNEGSFYVNNALLSCLLQFSCRRKGNIIDVAASNGPFTLGATRAAQALDARLTNHVVAPSVNPA